MKKLIYVSIILVLLILSSVSWYNVNNQQQEISMLQEKIRLAEEKTNLLLIGSSVTQGLGATSPEKSWSGLLYSFLTTNNKNINVINLGVNGYTTQSVINNTLKITGNLNSLDLTPDVIIFEICSINDFAKISYSESEKNINTILKRLKDQFPKSKIILMPSNNVTVYADQVNKDGLTYQQFVDMLESYIKSQKYTYIDFWDKYNETMGEHGLSLNETLSNDGKHPNNKGYTIWFNSIKDHFRYLQ